jgi:putative sterol carrier protein
MNGDGAEQESPAQALESQEPTAQQPAKETAVPQARDTASDPSVEESERSAPKIARKRFFKIAKELILDELPLRAKEASPKLKDCLVGSVAIKLKERGEQYQVLWNADGFQVSEGAGAADCTIHLSEQHLLKIASGDLNPQIAMLSDKIFVEGKLSLGVYFFNLVAPPSN